MQHSDLKEFISELDPNLTLPKRINAVVAALGETEGSSKENVAAMEQILAEKIGYQKEDKGSQAKIQRQYDSSLIKQAIAEAELEIQFERTNHEQARQSSFQTKRYQGVLNSLYGKEPAMQGFDKKSPEEQGAFYIQKLEAALKKFPRATAPDVSDTEIVKNYRAILELYNLTLDLDYAKPIILAQPNGQELHAKYAAMQNNMAILNGRAFLMASPYYSEIDYAQLMRTPMDLNLKEALAEHANDLDSGSLKPDIYMIETLQENLKTCRKEALEKLLPKSGAGTVEHFGADGKSLDENQKETALSIGAPLLTKITGQNDEVSIKAFLPSSPFSSGVEELSPEQYLDYARGASRAEIADLALELDQSKSFLRGSSDQFKDMNAALERLYSHNLSTTAATPSTQNLLSRKDALEELLESTNAYLQYKAQSRAGTDTVADYSKLGKNKYEQDHINAALKLRSYAQAKLDVYNLLEQDGDFMARAAANEEALRNAPNPGTRNEIANLRAACAQRNPEPWEVRDGGERMEQLHHAVGRDLRKLAEFACLDRPLDATEKAEIRTRMARAVALDLVRSERASNKSPEIGNLERAAAQNPEKFVAGVAKSKPFQKAMDKITPENLTEMLSGNGIQNIRQEMLAQAASVGAKPAAPAKVPEAVQPAVQAGPKV